MNLVISSNQLHSFNQCYTGLMGLFLPPTMLFGSMMVINYWKCVKIDSSSKSVGKPPSVQTDGWRYCPYTGCSGEFVKCLFGMLGIVKCLCSDTAVTWDILNLNHFFIFRQNRLTWSIRYFQFSFSWHFQYQLFWFLYLILMIPWISVSIIQWKSF